MSTTAPENMTAWSTAIDDALPGHRLSTSAKQAAARDAACVLEAMKTASRFVVENKWRESPWRYRP